MLAPTMCVLSKFMALLVKTSDDSVGDLTTMNNF
jgi:hypothetical protein